MLSKGLFSAFVFSSFKIDYSLTYYFSESLRFIVNKIILFVVPHFVVKMTVTFLKFGSRGSVIEAISFQVKLYFVKLNSSKRDLF